MAFALHPFYNLLLNTDIKDKIMLKIKYIQAYKNWSDFDLRIYNDAIGVTVLSCDDIEKQCDIWKDIAQLSIDLWTDYDYYRQFMFENKYDNREYNCRLFNLGCIYNDGLWKSGSKPDENVVQTNIFIYCLYCLISREMKRNEAIINQERITCSFCNFDIPHGEDSCPTCNASMEEIRVHRTVVYENENKIPNLVENTKVEDDLGECGVWLSKTGGEESLESKESNDSGIEGKERTGWKCGRCSLLNENGFVTCVACEGLYEDGTWFCDQCKIEISCGLKRCGVCNQRMEARNDAPTVLVDPADKKSRSRKDRWKCGRCSLWESYEREICGTCGSQRVADGSWGCHRCTFINKCITSQCGVCDSVNIYLSVTKCQRCAKKKTGIRKNLCRPCRRLSSRWQCHFSHCRELNDAAREYCHRCQLCRSHSLVRGDSVMQWSGTEAVSVWLCYGCSTTNSVTYAACFVCDRSRFKRRFCDDCGDLNDGLSHNCEKCYRLLS